MNNYLEGKLPNAVYPEPNVLADFLHLIVIFST